MKPGRVVHHAKHPNILRTSIKTALVVGTILALINHYDSFLALSFTSTQVLQILLTYFVPFSVASFAAAKHAEHLEQAERHAHHRKHR